MQEFDVYNWKYIDAIQNKLKVYKSTYALSLNSSTTLLMRVGVHPYGPFIGSAQAIFLHNGPKPEWVMAQLADGMMDISY